MNNADGVIETLEDFADDKTGHWERWNTEFNAADKAQKKFQTQGNRTVAKYLNDTKEDKGIGCFKLNLFHSNITTMQSMMFGKLPEISFSRTNMDASDDIARVAGMMFERMLNADIGTPDDQYSEALKQNLQDRLLPGLGISRVRYTFEEEEVEVAAVQDIDGTILEEASTTTQIADERAPLDYVHWRDFKWSPARIWAEVRWEAFRTLMSRDQLIKRFGEEVGKKIPLTKNPTDSEEQIQLQGEDPKQDAFQRAEIWEIWDKEARKVHWYCSGYKKLLDTKPDPLELKGFWPNPEPMTSNVTTTAFMPIPDYVMAQDLYNEIDQLETRITKITEAIKVVGVYDQSAEGVKRLFSEALENDLIPVDNWAMFAEKGGLNGTVDWLPIEEISNVLSKLVERRNDAQALLNQVTGMSDIMQGGRQAAGAVSATERALEARFSSVRIQALQDEFAKYATDLIRLRAQVITKHFQPKSIIEQSNILSTADKDLAGPAIQLIKTDPTLIWRIEVKPESVAMVDYAQLKEERTNYITALATFMQSAAPLVQMEPAATPVLLGLLQWGMAGFKGSQEVEGILDQAINQIKSQQTEGGGEEEPSPEQIKAEQEQAKMQHEQQKLQSEQNFEREKWKYEREISQQEHQQRMVEIEANSNADLTQEEAQAGLNIMESEAETEEIITRETAKARLARKTESQKSAE